MRFDVLRDNDDPMKFYFYEVYKDEAARLAHREMPHFAEWAKFMKHGLDREIIRHSTTNFHPPDRAPRILPGAKLSVSHSVFSWGTSITRKATWMCVVRLTTKMLYVICIVNKCPPGIDAVPLM